ncbi:MAG TPA: lysylphosphatidylglycerol synthase transmembrane domain-containing protein [Acidimicrobiales bacterium]|nr:lysylphosphatidylglycerol synthase transmembrane domain-containing protein [Acidimicrobiales bacterium]
MSARHGVLAAGSGPEAPDTGGEGPGPEVVLRPRRRQRAPGDVLRLLLGLVLLVVGLFGATLARNTVGGVEADIVEAYERIPDRVAEVLTAFAYLLAAGLPFLAIVVLLLRRRFRRALALLLGGYVATWALVGLDRALADRGVVERVRADTGRNVELTDPRFATSPLIASVVAMVVIASPWLSQRWRRALWSGVGVLVVLRMVSSGQPAFDVVLALAVGVVVGSAALVVIGTPSADPEAAELVAMLRPVAPATRIEQVDRDDPLAYRIAVAGEPPLAMTVRTDRDRSADLLGRLWRYARLRSTEVDRPHVTVQRRVEHEALAQSLAAAGGARVATVRSVISSPGGAVGLVTDAVDGSPATAEGGGPDRAALVDAWRQVGRLHAAGIAHRSLGLRRFTVTRDGQAVLTGFDDARVAASPRDLARDTAQLLVATALVVGTDQAVEVAVEAVGPADVVAAVPYLQPLALPGSTRRALRGEQGRGLLGALRDRIEDLTGSSAPPLARLERVRPRTALSVVAFAVAFYVFLPQLADVQRSADAASQADWWWLIPGAVASAGTYLCAAVAMVGSVPQPIPFLATLRAQVASSFASRIAPANTGALAVGVRFLQRAGVAPTIAATSVGLNMLAGLVMHLVLLAAFVAWTGTSGVGGFSLPDTSTVLLVIAVVLSASGLVLGLVPALRRKVVPQLLAQARKAGGSLTDVMTDPGRVLALLAGSAGVTLTYIAALAACVAAFGGGLSLPQIGAAYLVAAALGSVAPTPGGLGAVEAALQVSLTGYGMPDGPALATVLTFRLLTFWLPILPGWITFQQMTAREEL